MALDSKMEILKANYVNTTTQLAVNSNSTTTENLFNPDATIQYSSDDFADDATTSTLVISFDETTTVDRIALKEMNLKKFTIFYNGATASTFGMTSTGSTTTSAWVTNSASSMYLRLNGAVACTSVSIDMYSTQVAASEKAIGHVLISKLDSELERQPSSDNYSPKVDPEQVVHQMSDGGVRVHTVNKKYSVDLKLKFVSRTFRDYLQGLYNSKLNFVFAPFGTTTSWDDVAFEAVWVGKFEFFKFSDNASAPGFSGNISIRETSA